MKHFSYTIQIFAIFAFSIVGDYVYSYDTLTGEVTSKEVTTVFVRESDHINYLTFIDENGNEQVIESTDVHPFWVVTDEPDLERAARSVVDENGVTLYHENLESGLNGYWVEAKDLRVGDVVLGANGELSTLVSSERVVFPDGIKVYNFMVDGNHNYFIIAQVGEYGQTCILVHNARECNILGKSGEAQSGIKKNTEAYKVGDNKSRIPDGITKTCVVEVKNVAKQSLTSQIRDYLRIMDDLGKKALKLIVRKDNGKEVGTKLSGPLKALVSEGKIKIIRKIKNP